uniref:Uncharacterized protein AlNc14C32G2969 n=1 Tax=Albugo laibachii Nc14 TaxID=890382 RepID=F0W820_9STRA|nr:conserved hypothetical protein [Albugo laibachii Nc14]|eukprot:CCA17273.1 conserved hypothetical protein [Albugo laibachii Nc14]
MSENVRSLIAGQNDAKAPNVQLLRLYQIPSPEERTIEAQGAGPHELKQFHATQRRKAMCPLLGGIFLCEEQSSNPENLHMQSSHSLHFNSLSDSQLLGTIWCERFVVDVRVHGAFAAVLTEHQEIDLIELGRCQVVRTIREVVNSEIALGSEWIVFSSSSPLYWFENTGDSNVNLEYEKRFRHEAPSSDTLIGNKTKYRNSQSTSPSFTAVDVAQSLASGFYYLGELGRSTLSPYFSSPPEIGQSRTGSNSVKGEKSDFESSSTSLNQMKVPFSHSGSVIVQSLQSEQILCRIKCHSSPIAALALDRSGLLIATCSTKGQNVHVYRLLPALDSKSAENNEMDQRYQLLYKLQRGITHVHIIDIAFSQDSKWITVTSARGTSHVYAIHPEGGRVTQCSHLIHDTDVEDGQTLDDFDGMHRKHIDDFCADYRILETKKVSQVTKFHHSFPATLKSGGNGRKERSVLESALDVSQTFMNQCALTPSPSFLNYMGDPDDGRQQQSLKGKAHLSPISCCFSHENSVLFCCNFGDVLMRRLKCHPIDRRGTSSESRMHEAQFDFDVTFDVVSRWNMWQFTDSQKRIPRNLSTKPYTAESKCDGKSELRTCVGRDVPLWARPSIMFRVTDEANPKGRILEVNRRGPNATRRISAADNLQVGQTLSEENVFVLEMDSYFGTGKSPVFDGQGCNPLPDIPTFNLCENIDTAMHSSVEYSKECDTEKLNSEVEQMINELHLIDRPEMHCDTDAQCEHNGSIAGIVLQESYFDLPKDQV